MLETLQLCILLGVASLASAAVSVTSFNANTITAFDLKPCPTDAAFAKKLERPSCKLEAYRIEEGAVFIQNRLNDARRCDQGQRTEAEKDEFWNYREFERVVDLYTCKMKFGGEYRMVVRPALAVALINIMASQCYPDAPRAPEVDRPNVLACAPSRTLPFVEAEDRVEYLMDGAGEQCPLADVPLEELTEAQQLEYFAFFVHLKPVARQRKGLLYARSDRAMLIYDHIKQAERPSDEREAKLEYYHGLAERSYRLGVYWRNVTVWCDAWMRYLRWRFPHLQDVQVDAVSRYISKTYKYPTLRCVSDGNGDDDNQGDDDDHGCSDHVWVSNINIKESCYSACVFRLCDGDYLDGYYCVRWTVQVGLTRATCHANGLTRHMCFYDIYRELGMSY
mmetsp:Transcript_11040/g.33858  ORF Transcript_11040/g.33858 Transcript_11040/m.33858 type:complete len:393 (-) Transcript_11040:262-1440(-)|eukprot:CAMPEP_0198729900 /NCGR_PEP_ID=MMETSP1475-20131203/21612_1 /TAXON_ID= ORGANISM="Unidentified sp., Strain CCMP1999" /NCGR_SAMPLE_ID=MMETSP1475 /ASSEMBLY_ACC=CAM_ASM_001111 /LENGTH=392 /DNA_ID=CAMNT_0044492623 /DNA_START=66 /DNA_END=1244 /DNA_ORIENTATION=-